MSESAGTPRTDAAERECSCTVNGAIVSGIVTVAFARTLERELADCRAELELLRAHARGEYKETKVGDSPESRLASPAEREGADELARHLDGEHHAIVAQQIDSPMNACSLKPTCLWLKKLAASQPAPSAASGLADRIEREGLRYIANTIGPEEAQAMDELIIACLRSHQAPVGEETSPRCYGYGPQADCPLCKGTGVVPSPQTGGGS